MSASAMGVAHARMTADEFLVWDAAEDGKYELQAGLLVATRRQTSGMRP